MKLDSLLLSLHLPQLADELLANLDPVQGPVVEHALGRPALGTLLHLIHLRQFDVVDSLVDPLVPVHVVLSIEFDTAELHGEILVIGARVTGE